MRSVPTSLRRPILFRLAGKNGEKRGAGLRFGACCGCSLGKPLFSVTANTHSHPTGTMVRAACYGASDLQVAVDTVSPRVTPLNRSQWKSGNIQFKIGDAETGVRDYKVMIDGRFELFSFSSKTARLSMKYPKRLKRGVPHKLEVIVTDYCGNETRKEYKF